MYGIDIMASRLTKLCIHLAVALPLGLLITGCSDFKFVGKSDLNPTKDSRENIVLAYVDTQMTSGGLVQQRIVGKDAIFSDSSNDLTIKNLQLTTFGDTKETQSITRADVGQIYFADDPSRDVGRKDMKFAGNVLYRTPNKVDVTTDSLRMTSDLVLWNERDKKFISPQGYEMVLYPKGQKPIRQSGKGFEATQDLSRFVVKSGAVTTKMEGDPALEREQLLQQFAQWKEAAETEANKPSSIPLTIPLPVQ